MAKKKIKILIVYTYLIGFTGCLPAPDRADLIKKESGEFIKRDGPDLLISRISYLKDPLIQVDSKNEKELFFDLREAFLNSGRFSEVYFRSVPPETGNLITADILN